MIWSKKYCLTNSSRILLQKNKDKEKTMVRMEEKKINGK